MEEGDLARSVQAEALQGASAILGPQHAQPVWEAVAWIRRRSSGWYRRDLVRGGPVRTAHVRVLAVL